MRNEAGRPRERDRRDPLGHRDPEGRADPRERPGRLDEGEPWVLPDDMEAFADFELPGEGALNVEEAFGEHEIEYWVWHDNRLIPAPPDKVARIRELEALRRLDEWRALQQRERSREQRRARPTGWRRAWGRLRAALAGALERDAPTTGAGVTVPGGDVSGDGGGRR